MSMPVIIINNMYRVILYSTTDTNIGDWEYAPKRTKDASRARNATYPRKEWADSTGKLHFSDGKSLARFVRLIHGLWRFVVSRARMKSLWQHGIVLNKNWNISSMSPMRTKCNSALLTNSIKLPAKGWRRVNVGWRQVASSSYCRTQTYYLPQCVLDHWRR